MLYTVIFVANGEEHTITFDSEVDPSAELFVKELANDNVSKYIQEIRRNNQIMIPSQIRVYLGNQCIYSWSSFRD